MHNCTYSKLFLAAVTGTAFYLASPTAMAYNTGHLNTLRSGVKAWNSMRAAHADVVPDLSGADLKGRNLKGADLHNADLTGTDLSQSNLGNADLKHARMDHAKLSDSNLMKADLEGAELRDADLERAILDHATCRKARLKGAIIKKADCRNTDFSEAELAVTNLREAYLANANFEGSDLSDAYLWRANMSGAKMKGVKVSPVTVLDTGKYATASWAEKNHAVFTGASEPVSPGNTDNSRKNAETKELQIQHEQSDSSQQAARPSLTGENRRNHYRAKENKTPSANIWRLSSGGPLVVAYDRQQFEMLKSNALKWNEFRKSDRNMVVNLKGAPLDGKNLAYADLNRASLSGAGFRKADLSQGDLRYADLRGCDLREANLQHADLGEADLRGANLWRANIGRARFEGALVSASTVLDTGKKATPELAERYGMKFSAE
ncbi:MAG: pentapeptide repeat-containing protein [Chlorobiaceae bacterium]|nr:pentapeptide repeat-containing protein [Chlorobiaceae bacterium]